jgi:hypothetical protein
MSTEKMREEFEAAVAIKSGEPFAAIYFSRQGDTYKTSPLHFAWWAWQKSRMDLAAKEYCDRNQGCVCGGDTEGVRRGCGHWVKP